MISPRTQPKRIVDVNGHEKTVHVVPEGVESKGASRIAGISPAVYTEPRPYANHSPAEIDVPLAAIYEKLNTLDMREYSLRDAIATEKRYRDRIIESQGEDSLRAKGHNDTIARYEVQIEKIQDDIEELKEEARPYEREFSIRGGWNRYFEVTNSNGHIHTSMQCSTCYPTTSYYWHADRSGMSHDDLVEQAGESACTVCFPNAPVEALQRPKTLETPDNKAKREAREERERKAAERAAKAAATGISLPDGSPLRDSMKYVVKTERMAEQGAVSDAIWLYGNPDLAPTNEYIPKYKNALDDAIDALGYKRGQERSEVVSTLIEKGKAKMKRGGWGAQDIEGFVDRATKALLS